MTTSFQNSPYFICHYGVKGRYKGYLDTIKGMKRDRWTGEMRNYTPKELERLRRKVLKSYMNTPGG